MVYVSVKLRDIESKKVVISWFQLVANRSTLEKYKCKKYNTGAFSMFSDLASDTEYVC